MIPPIAHQASRLPNGTHEARAPRVDGGVDGRGGGSLRFRPQAAPVRITVMGRVRTEASVSLTLAWNPCDPIDERDVPVLRRFLAAVRELAHGGQLRVAGDISLLDRAIGVGDITVADLPVEPGLTRLETQEKHLIISALRRHHGHRVRAADDVGMSVRTLQNRCRHYGIDPDDFAAPIPEVVTA